MKQEEISKLEWCEWDSKNEYYGNSRVSKCGRYIYGWEWQHQKGCGFKAYYIIDVLKGTKTGGALI